MKSAGSHFGQGNYRSSILATETVEDEGRNETIDVLSTIEKETIARFLGLGNRAADLGKKSLLDKIAVGRFELDYEGISNFQDAVRMGSGQAILEAIARDPAGTLNLCRKFHAGDKKLYEKTLDEDTLKRHGEEFEPLYVRYKLHFKMMIDRLETIVKWRAKEKEIESYGVKVTGDRATDLGIVTPPLSLDNTPPKAFLGAWGSTFVRFVAALKARGVAHEDAVDNASKRLTVQIESISESASNSMIADASMMLAFAGSWVGCGMPIIQPSHKLAASLMATSLPKEHVPDVIVPWPYFLVEIPDGLLPGVGALLSYVGLSLFDDQQNSDKPQYVVIVLSKRHSRPTLFRLDDLSHLSEYDPFNSDVRDPEVERIVQLLGRLLLGAMIEIDDESFKQRIERGPSSSALDHEHRKGKVPSTWNFIVKRDVKVDVRSYVREYAEKGGRGLSVQCLVRGHRKRQPYGPKGSLRKWVHIEPYWKGPENAPIALRKHKVNEQT